MIAIKTLAGVGWMSRVAIGLMTITVIAPATLAQVPPTRHPAGQPPANSQATSGATTDAASTMTLAEPALTESSGLAFSNRRPGYFWSHNDSGDQPRLFAFDADGRSVGTLTLPNDLVAIDWEDMASFVDRGTSRLIVADSGDNQAKRANVQLHLFDEPDPARLDRLTGEDRLEVQTITVTFADGPRDCEAVAVDVRRRMILLITKSFFPLCDVYVIPMPAAGTQPSAVSVQARRIGKLAIPLVSAADIDPQSGDLWIVNYFLGYRFTAPPLSATWADVLSTLPKGFELPRLKQIEAVAVDRQTNVWVTSEGSPTLIRRVSITKTDDN